MKRFILTITVFLLLFNLIFAQSIPAPVKVFGFRMGTDKKLINWQQIVDYFKMLDEQSPRLKLVEIGRTTLDRPMIMAIIGDESTIANLQRFQQIQ